MRCGGKALVWAAVACTCSLGAQGTIADSPDNPYQAIVERNVFGLKPPPPPPSTEPPKAPAPKITLTGITTILGSKQALLTVQRPPKPGGPGKPAEPGKSESLILSEGERQGEVEVLEIDDVAYTIKVDDYGEIMTIALEKPKESPNVPGQPGVPGFNPYAPGLGGARPPVPGAYQPPTATAIPPAGAKPTLPTRTLRLPQAGGVPPPPPGPVPAPSS